MAHERVQFAFCQQWAHRVNARAAIIASGCQERQSHAVLVQQLPPSVGKVWAKRRELTPSHDEPEVPPT